MGTNGREVILSLSLESGKLGSAFQTLHGSWNNSPTGKTCLAVFLLYLEQFLQEEESGELRLWVPRIIPRTYPVPAPSQAQTCV